MTLEQLRIFIAVAEREHVTRAARDLNLTQSATSAAVAALEERHATKLFDRVGRRIELTEAGRLFLVEARAVLARAASAEAVLADLAGLKRGALHIAASQTVSNYWLPPLMHRYQAHFPGIAMRLTIGNTEQVAAAVHEGLADLGFVEGEIDDPALEITPAADDELVLVVGTSHAWAGRKSIAPSDLRSSRWVLREPGSGTRAMFEEALIALGIRPAELDVALELSSNEAVRTAVEAGAGATVMSSLVTSAAVAAGTLVQMPVTLPKRRFLAIRHKERHATRAAREFLALAAENGKAG
ncbi:LysR family transcriptional regulator [Mesorhizobium sp. CGMCC 1.15528]|uniref:LysR family transcriptional regulator n=1 Tax=Mesorhizobium zhangyense TaxID=1776730 RepID=A0A7C9R6U9_9HYPH|nr:LysR family transcriptional regulator [Mesorhizobium zhangyense]NGN41018.1 LysR family transcriptional regulator [Mesorhizobium zhangyense]